jgi:hypothetical protein
MGSLKNFGRRAAACVLAVTMSFSTVPPVAARDAVLGSVIVSGSAFAATPTTDWVRIDATRPLVSGDRFKTDQGAGLVADFGKLGIVGLYENSEVAVVEQDGRVIVEAQRGKVAFYIAPQSPLKLTAAGATVASGASKAEGYVEFNAQGAPELVVESENANVVVAAGETKIYARGDRVVLTDNRTELAQTGTAADDRKAGAMEPAAKSSSKKVGGLSPLGWTAIAGVIAAVGIGVGVGVGGGGGGGGDDNGSE